MKKILFFCLFLLLSFSVFAQTAKIIEVKGDVSVKKDMFASWQDAKVGMLLNKSATVKTEADSECTLSFDNNLKNTLTIKENSQLKLDSISPGRVNLPKGRVFSLLEGLAKRETFEVRTPVAIAGARGTGNSTEHGNNGTTVSAFEDTTYVKGLDKDGNVSGEKDLTEGSGLGVDADGNLGDITRLGSRDLREWGDFKGSVERLRLSEDTGDKDDETLGTGIGSLDDLKDEHDDGLRDDSFEGERQEKDPGCN